MIPEDARPHGDRISWADDEERVAWDFTTEPYTTRPYTDAENIEADIRAENAEQAAAVRTLRQQIRALLDERPTTAADRIDRLERGLMAVIRLVARDD